MATKKRKHLVGVVRQANKRGVSVLLQKREVGLVAGHTQLVADCDNKSKQDGEIFVDNVDGLCTNSRSSQCTRTV